MPSIGYTTYDRFTVIALHFYNLNKGGIYKISISYQNTIIKTLYHLEEYFLIIGHLHTLMNAGRNNKW